MLKSIIKPALVALSMSVAAVGAWAADGAALLRKVDDIRAPGANFTFDLTLNSGGKTEKMEVSVQNSTKGLVRYTKPTKMAGRSILFVDKNMWVFVPGTRRALRISPQQRVLGGVSSADVARTVYSSDYKVVSTSGSGNAIVLQLTPKTKSAAYARIDLTVTSSGAPKQAVFYAGGGRKLKTMHFGGYKSVLGASRPTQLKVVDHLEGGKVTTMTYSSFKKAKTPAAWYQPNNLSRL
ncbi:outer membrane lipoprotein-sorting protein [Phaeobacter sp.]|uniref:outer membrane lipoprotein-sorting protein n=1 Tax=Phaeobacter sp. TaxID=1902409 RepID=UPI0025FC1B6F|nr:outer membrane lipoprotein-sorting protein [Phaeobacter sp.]